MALLIILYPFIAAAETPQAAPSLSGRLLDGKNFQLAAHRGHVVILHFWATWCAPCRAEMTVLNDYYRKHRSEGLDMLAISMDDRVDLDKVKAAMQADRKSVV